MFQIPNILFEAPGTLIQLDFDPGVISMSYRHKAYSFSYIFKNAGSTVNSNCWNRSYSRKHPFKSGFNLIITLNTDVTNAG